MLIPGRDDAVLIVADGGGVLSVQRISGTSVFDEYSFGLEAD